MAKMVKYSKKLIKAYQALSEFIVKGAVGHPPSWPFPIIETNWYHSKFLPKEIYSTYKALKRKRIGNKEIAKLFWGPSAITHWLYIIEPYIATKKKSPFKGLSLKETIEFLETTIDLLYIQRKKDIFCKSWRNIIFSQQEIKNVLGAARFLNVSKNKRLARIISQINTILWHYCIQIQIGHRSYSQEFHGPYSLGDKKILFVRDYFNLRPFLAWDFTKKFLYERIRILEIYREGKIKVDMFNHFEISKSAKIQQVAIQINGERFLNEREILTLFKSCLNTLEEGNKAIKNFKKKDWVRKIIEMRYLWLKPAKDLLGKNWQPPSKVYYLVGKINQAEKSGIKFGQKMRTLMIALSPQGVMKKLTQLFLNNIPNPFQNNR